MKVLTGVLALSLAACSSNLGGDEGSLPGGGAGPDADLVGNTDSDCPQVAVDITSVTPTVMVLVDRSGTMDRGFSGTSRWDAVYDTLMNRQNGALRQLEGQVRFGLTLYTGQDGNPTCPILDTVPPRLDNADSIDALYAARQPVEDTPTGESLSAIAAQLAAITDPGPKAIVLATDGEPDSCADPDPDGQPAAKALAISAAVAAEKSGINTYVISVGDEVSQGHLQDMANAGAGLAVGGPSNAPYYQALNSQQLVDAFDTIIGGVQSCSFAIDGEVDEAGAASGVVTLDGSALAFGDDWELADPSTLRLIGSACDTVKGGGDHSLTASFSCDTITVD